MRAGRILAGLGAALALAGCAHELQVPRTVSVPTAVACIDQEARTKLEAACPPLRTDAEIKQLDDYKAAQALLADRARASGCMTTQQAAIAACAKVPAATFSSSGDGRRE